MDGGAKGGRGGGTGREVGGLAGVAFQRGEGRDDVGGSGGNEVKVQPRYRCSEVYMEADTQAEVWDQDLRSVRIV